ncbi:DUF4186 domain-containing protein [Brevibacterium aurantiacum]|nr:DUF4186 domain-containing protein [Brevibacterium aurantiacum]AZL11338.1 DUF4186 domain-containing protein [Brevibacterium aurantiacum]
MKLDQIERRLAGITAQPFRAHFHLRETERRYLESRGMDTIRRHADDFISRRLAPAHPNRDGQQTPWGGHPVFRAQHATATCCRGCLETNHHLARGRELDEQARAYVVEVICRWIEAEYDAAVPEPPLTTQPRLF